ncbi:MAG: SAF domain-containing protein [Armatimonadota bacterium]|nr:SAF domain-containing protein [Armatimonadota bacterium]MDR7453842.1 SAF domain-containing protein [Armatimonadota bacterium]MDR7456443.1 SAF domain-containing protein [Armatimonadota bacterium]MDR7496879.1 SAF domain-containing protein [Armatimonadota bacterium]
MRTVERLQALEREGRPFRVAVVGAGQMGSGLVRQVARTPGLRVAGICDVVEARAAAAAAAAGLAAAPAASVEDIGRLVRDGRTAVGTRAAWFVDAEGVDVVLDATGDPEVAAALALGAIARRRPFVTMTVEADVTVGPILAWMARAAGTVYTVAAGDEPAVLCEMVDAARLMGFRIVCAGKGKNNRLDRTATPAAVAAEAVARGMSPRMLTAFVDGTKTMVEMAALANAAGLHVDCPGMHGPKADLADLLRIFVPEADGGILRRSGAVEYAIGDVAPGVFLVVAADDAVVRRDLDYLKMGPGPYYLLHRPYHLASLEAPLSVVRALLHAEVTMAPQGPPVATCAAVAKRDLAAGEVLDEIGGETVYGMADAVERAAAVRALPVGVVAGARVLRDAARGTVLTADHLALDETRSVVSLWRLQEAMMQQEAVGGRA